MLDKVYSNIWYFSYSEYLCMLEDNVLDREIENARLCSGVV